MPTSAPTAPPRSKKPITKNDISEPYDFQHVAHVGLDFKSEDVRNAIKPRLSPGRQASPQPDNIYESVYRQETPILIPASQREDLPPPMEFAPEYISAGASTTSAPISTHLNAVPPAPLSNRDVSDYENRPTPHMYQNIEIFKDRPRPSKKKHPPPPPPQSGKPKLQVAEEPAPSVAFRTQVSVPKFEPAEVPMMNDTPRRIEASPVSVIIERPGMLGEMRLGLDDPIPLMTGTPSKYRTPSMLTPKEMAVDVPTPLRTPEIHSPRKEEAPRPPLVKEIAVDVPPTPSAAQNFFPAEHDHKRRAPSPPTEPDALPPRYQPYQPVGVAKVPPQMKNVISELKTRQSKDEIVEEDGEEGEEHEYVSLSQYKRVSAEEPRSLRGEKGDRVEGFPVLRESVELTLEKAQEIQEEPQKPAPVAKAPKVEMPAKELSPAAKETKELVEKGEKEQPAPLPAKNPVPVPKPRRTAPSLDIKEEEEPEEPSKTAAPTLGVRPRSPETRQEDSSIHDDGIDTGCSDDDTEVIRL